MLTQIQSLVKAQLSDVSFPSLYKLIRHLAKERRIIITSRGRRFLLRREHVWTISQFQGATFHESTSLDLGDRGPGGLDACHTHWPSLSDCESGPRLIASLLVRVKEEREMPTRTDSRHSDSARAKTKSPQVRRAREETLDPDDWDEVRRLGHRMLDDMMDYLSSVRERPAWQAVPADVKQSLSGLYRTSIVPWSPCIAISSGRYCRIPPATFILGSGDGSWVPAPP